MQLFLYIFLNEEFDESLEMKDIKLEELAAEEGLRYVGGYIAHKFPHYPFLRWKQQDDTNESWIRCAERHEVKLLRPNSDFFEKLKIMDCFFNKYHGGKSLKPGKGVVRLYQNWQSYLFCLKKR